jgi:hypothetical protein
VAKRLVGAARKERDKHHEVGQGEEPLFGLGAGSFSRASDHAEMTAAREVMKVIDANAGQAGNFGVGEDLLTRFDSNQRSLASSRRFRLRLLPDSMLRSG